MLLVIGKTGQIATALRNLLGDNALYLGREELDLSQPETIDSVLRGYTPTAIINAAAYTQVDKAEEEEALATRINGESVGKIAEFCVTRNIPFVHYSSDYVYEGAGTHARSEEEPPAPLGAYGRSKLAGDTAIVKAGGKYLILRTSWVYDAQGKNFVNTMLRLGAERESLKVVADQYGAPSYAPHLAEATLAVLEKAMAMPSFPSGIYHFCNSGETSWHGFATRIFEQARQAGIPLKIQEVHPITSAEYPTPAKRPTNSRMNMTKLKNTFALSLPAWEEGLSDCMRIKYHESAGLPA